MRFALQAAAMEMPGYLRLGGLRLPVFGIFAAAGLIAALWLSQRSATRAGLSAHAVWDAGVFAVVAAFVASRVLLVVFNLSDFLKYPLLLLALPSLTYAGMVLTALMVWAWLRWKRLPVRDVLDAWAPCAALLAGVLSVGHFVEGTDAGMPTRLPWGVLTPGDTVLGRVHPVQIYGSATALGLSIVLWRMMPKRKFAGHIAALALMAGGAISLLLDMLRQPAESYGTSWLDPAQFAGLAAMVAGVALMTSRPDAPSRAESLTPFALASDVHRGRSVSLEEV